MNEKVEENSRWEEHSAGLGRGRRSLVVPGKDWRAWKMKQMANRERKMTRDQIRERVEQRADICRPL